MRKLVLFDLDQTLVDSRAALPMRRRRQWSAVYAMIPDFSLYSGIKMLWNHFESADHLTGVVTSSPRPYCKRVIDHFSISVDVMVCYHDTWQHKPDPSPLLRAMSLTCTGPEKTLYVGDTHGDMRAATAAGVLGIGALWGSDHESKLQATANLCFKTVGDLHARFLEVDQLPFT